MVVANSGEEEPMITEGFDSVKSAETYVQEMVNRKYNTDETIVLPVDIIEEEFGIGMRNKDWKRIKEVERIEYYKDRNPIVVWRNVIVE